MEWSRWHKAFASASRGQRWVERLVDPLEPVRLEPPGDRQRLAEKALRGSEQHERVTVELTIVQEFHPIDTAEAGDAKQALRHLVLQTRGVSEQHRSCSKQNSVANQSESAQHVGRLPAQRLLQPSLPHRLGNRAPNLSYVEVVDRPPGGGLILPPLLAVHAFEQHPLVLLGRHGRGSVPDATVGSTTPRIRSGRSGIHAHDDHVAVAGDANAFDRWKRRRLDPTQIAAQPLDRASAHLLSDHDALWRDSDQHPSAVLVQKGADGHRDLPASSSRGLEFQHFRFAGRRQ